MFTHEEIITLLQERKDKLDMQAMATAIGISNSYFNSCVNQTPIKGKVPKIHKKHFPKIINYLNDLAVKNFANKVADEVLQ